KKEEEEALINCLLELSCDQQWKGEGGFKNGYLNQLEIMLNNKFPNYGLKAIPHIESKFKWFKDKYTVVSEMVNKTSGFQWDDGNKMIIANGITSELLEDSIHNLEKETINLNDDNNDKELFLILLL
ncbi:ATP-dependent DNA helicase II subunit 1, partial [Bienertia sinuspersici]